MHFAVSDHPSKHHLLGFSADLAQSGSQAAAKLTNESAKMWGPKLARRDGTDTPVTLSHYLLKRRIARRMFQPRAFSTPSLQLPL